MKKTWTIVFTAVIAVCLILCLLAYLGIFGGDGGVKHITAPQQSKAGIPACFPDPYENWVKLPETKNLAEGGEVKAGEITDVYNAANVTDGDTATYWESKGFPAEITVALDGTHTVRTVGVRLNPAAIWEPRAQFFSVLVSTDGVNFTEVSTNEKYDFTPDTGNIVRVDFKAAEAAYVKLIFTANSSSRTGGAQAAEIEVYE